MKLRPYTAGWLIRIERLLLPLAGLASLIWFLIRVLPKPSRASYPCMRAAYPLASGFVIYLLSLFLTLFSWRQYRYFVSRHRNGLAMGCLLIGTAFGLLFLQQSQPAPAAPGVVLSDHLPNQPMGVGVGIHPGRVVWAYDPSATNEKCTGTLVKDGVIDNRDNLWFQAKNNDPAAIARMVSRAIASLAGVDSSNQAWDRLFHYFNRQKGRGEIGYRAGEKIFIKTNATSMWGEPGQWGMFKNDLSRTESWRPDIAETNPYVVLALLRELVHKAGVPQEAIYVGDPMKQIYKEIFTLWRTEFPNVHYLGNRVLANYANVDIIALGRTPVVKSNQQSIFYSDHGAVLAAKSDAVYTILEQADYLINVPTLKAHARAGITLAAKNHFGSHTRDNAEHLHNGLVSEPPNNDKPTRLGYGLYRVQVDLMEHKYLGGNTMLVVVDGLYPCDEAVNSPAKWKMAPFNNDWASSILVSQDQVAIESVCFDFLRTEYNGATAESSRPNWSGVDDYLHQAADSANWPTGIRYDADQDGKLFSSLGVHEHWNNATEKKYARNLGQSKGIELFALNLVPTAVKNETGQSPSSCILMQNYPNPFNGQTEIHFVLERDADASLVVFDQSGRIVHSLFHGFAHAGHHHVTWSGVDDYNRPVASGLYFCRLIIAQPDGMVNAGVKRMIMIK